MNASRLRRMSRALSLVSALLCGSPVSLAIEPEVHADRTVTFRISAPDAGKVQIDVKGRTSDANGGRPLDMTKDEDGVWKLTTAPLDPGFHYYFVIVDGFRCADSTSPLYFGWQRPTSGVEIPTRTSTAICRGAFPGARSGSGRTGRS